VKVKIDILSLGGTISMTSNSDHQGVVPKFGARDLVQSVPGLAQNFDFSFSDVAKLASCDIEFAHLFRLRNHIQSRVAAGVQGFVITQGTDTIEETAYALDLLLNVEVPVVITGAMRHAGADGADGPANLAAAVIVATSKTAHQCGVLVVMNDRVHAARFVQKSHTSSTDAFTSDYPLGYVSEGEAHFMHKLHRMPGLEVIDTEAIPYIPILKPALGDDGRLIQHVISNATDGIVVELAGAGHCSKTVAETLADNAHRIPIVFASRVRHGRLLRNTYGQIGGEIDLIRRGLISSLDLDALKARILLTLLHMSKSIQRFAEFADLSLRPI
jgi:L-asparaginase/Glu-tRNA(Gln) amidotransferase subunit D